MKKKCKTLTFCFLISLILVSCSEISSLIGKSPPSTQTISKKQAAPKPPIINRRLRRQILRLNPENISHRQVSQILSKAPAPKIVNLHGGIYPVHLLMDSFSRFLISMGYPEQQIQAAKKGDYSYSCYEPSKKLAGLIAWHYEHDGLRPMIIGHSQGGMQAVKVLYELDGKFNRNLKVWNPIYCGYENRTWIIDPRTKKPRQVVGIATAYVSAVGSGGPTRLLPNQWSMLTRLRKIPNTVREFTGFTIPFDSLGGDILGFSSLNNYKSKGNPKVRNIQLPYHYSHIFAPKTTHLRKNPKIKAWIDTYHPTKNPKPSTDLGGSTVNLLWAADVWYSIKKNWVIELQNYIRKKA